MEVGNSIFRLCQVFYVLSVCYIVVPTKTTMNNLFFITKKNPFGLFHILREN